MSAQFYGAAVAAKPEIPTQLAAGRFDILRSWLTDNVYHHGSALDPLPLVKEATGSPLGTTAYVDYLKGKYGALYELS